MKKADSRNDYGDAEQEEEGNVVDIDRLMID